MAKKFYITTPIYYASGNLHIGHLYTTTIAWVIRNYKRLQGFDAKMLTGSDEHGQKIAQSAAKVGLEPQTFVDQTAAKFVDLWKKFDIDYDFFIRTTNEPHKKFVKQIFTKLVEKGYIYKDFYRGLYSVSDEEFLTPKQAVFKDGAYYHPVSGAKVEEIEEESYFFDMQKMQDWLVDFWNKHPNFISEEKIKNELIKNFIEKGLENLSVTRTRQSWGIPTEIDPKHVIYVWLDALFNYVSTLNVVEGDPNNSYWLESEQIVHVVGKEITRFHCIYWPIFLKALDFRLPTNIITHGWLVTNEGKMSKSKGNVIDPLDILAKYDSEVIKLFFATQIPLGQDGIFDETNLTLFYNATLANNFGNLISRTVALIDKNQQCNLVFDSNVLEQIDKDIYSEIEQSQKEYSRLFDNLEVDKALKVAINLGKSLNLYIDLAKPWACQDDVRLNTILVALLNGIYATNVMFSVAMPKVAQKVSQTLANLATSLDLILNFNKFANQKIIKSAVIFPRITL
ncbi:methionine--tRNA ligase [Mesomycoplasma bovoculi]|uniref:Methionine--tRNA ligase n=1 Tax=Mesomycoplasma bovoculi M165/69 TaxID=743966 RepID=W5V0H3_9BACT|nr:methionine--tRNA ligase [Mesomycoplasma bovoculi]AHH45298.1 methionyl-tRNA synthetase [Mesomycoplasma bovoculi M165/69]